MSNRPAMHFATTQSGLANDLTGAVRVAYFFQSMSSPFSNNHLVNAPLGESFWNWQELTQAGQLLLLWAFSKLTSPGLAVLGVQLIGTAISLFAVHRLVTHLKASSRVADVVCLVILLSPIWQSAMSSFTSAVFFGIPILALVLASEAVNERSMIKLTASTLIAAGAFVIDGYWFYTCVISLIVFASMNIPTVIRWSNFGERKKGLLMASVVLSLLLFTFIQSIDVLIDKLNLSRGASRSLSLPIPEQIRMHGGNPLGAVVSQDESLNFLFGSLGANSNFNYIGLIVPISFLLGLFFRIGLKLFEKKLLVVAATLFLCGLQPYFSTPFGIVPSLSPLISQVLVGVTYINRLAIPAQVIFLCFSIVILSRLSSSSGKKVANENVLTIFLIIVFFLDYHHAGSRMFSKDDLRLESMRLELSNKSGNLLALPSTINGRGWLYQGYIQFPMVNGLRSMGSIAGAESAAVNGQAALAKWMGANNAKFLLVTEKSGVATLVARDNVLTGERMFEFNNEIDTELFSLVERSPMGGFDGKSFDLALYELVEKPLS